MLNNNKGAFLYPSAICGPLDTSKAKEKLGWVPTPLKVALSVTSHFFSGAEFYSEEHY